MKEGWEYRRFESCLIKVSKQVQVKSKDYKKEGKFPIVSQEAELISGYWDDEAIVYKHKEPVVIFGDHTKNIKYVDFVFVVGADGTHILSTKNDIVPKFFYYVLKSIKLRELGYARHYKLLKEKYIPVPPLSEQQSIVNYLDSAFAKIDAMKANAEKALNEAKALFQASLKEMLVPKEGWEEKTLPDISENLDSKRKPVTKGKREAGIYPYYGASGIVDYVSDYIFDEDILLISEDGANLVARSTPIAFSVSGKVWVNNHAHILRFKNIYTQYFVEYYFASIKIDEYVTGAAQPKFSQKNMNKLPIWIPSIAEQQSIVETLDSLKSKVDRLQENYEKISQECDALKQAILREVFE